MSSFSVVIPNYNGLGYMEDCLRAMRSQSRLPDTVIVVDNGSEDGSCEYIARRFPEVELIALPENTGFCGGVNTGIRASMEAGMDYVILLNNDTKPDLKFCEELVRAMDAQPRAFSCQAKMLKMDNPARMDDGGDLYCALGWSFARGKGRSERFYRKPIEIFSACAGAAIYRVSVLREIGLFDENHFAYLEDCDIGWRAQIAGYRNFFIPSAKTLHVGSASSGSIYNLFKVKNTSRNSVYLIYKNMPAPQILLNLPILLSGFAVKAVFFTEKGYGKEYLTGLLKGFAMCRKGRKEGKKVLYQEKNRPNYRHIQAALWVNTARRFLGR